MSALMPYYLGDFVSDSACSAFISTIGWYPESASGTPFTDHLAGLVYYNTVSRVLRFWNGVAWAAIGSRAPSAGHTMYVDSTAPLGGDGSFLLPFRTIQSAVSAIEAMSPSVSDIWSVIVTPGTYTEDVIVRMPTFNLCCSIPGALVNLVSPGTGAPLTITNATLASVAVYNITGDYADLVNMGSSGPANFYVSGFSMDTAGTYGLRLLGVKGDATADTTNFCDGATLHLYPEIKN